MLKCGNCKYNKDCIKVIRVEMENCTEYRPVTNGDRIRQMSDEELVDVFDHVQGDAFLVGIGQRRNSRYPGASMSWLDWLKEEAKDDAAD